MVRPAVPSSEIQFYTDRDAARANGQLQPDALMVGR
jgi:hypothetical protein